MNKVILLGRLTRDVDLKMSKDDKAYARTGIAVDRRFAKEDAADFLNVVAFGKTAEFLSKYFGKGDRLLIEGRLQTGSYEKDGVKHYTVDVVAENIEFADGKKDSSGNETAPAKTPPHPTRQAPPPKDEYGGTPIDESDMPF